MRVDIVIDTVCPWCYIGKARFERALAMRPAIGVEVGWRPFQLNPTMPAAGKDRSAYIAEKFGGPERAKRVYDTVIDAGRQERIEFQFGRIERTPNTLNSHRLLAFAGRRNCQTDATGLIFQAYFTDGLDIGDLGVLADVAARTGLDRGETLDFLESGEDRDHVLAEDELARSLGINGVPCYIIDRKYAVSGAQSPEVFLQVLDLACQDTEAVAAE